jgi:hypothetical protein
MPVVAEEDQVQEINFDDNSKSIPKYLKQQHTSTRTAVAMSSTTTTTTKKTSVSDTTGTPSPSAPPSLLSFIVDSKNSQSKLLGVSHPVNSKSSSIPDSNLENTPSSGSHRNWIVILKDEANTLKHLQWLGGVLDQLESNTTGSTQADETKVSSLVLGEDDIGDFVKG